MAPPSLTTIAPATVTTADPNMYLGRNISISNITNGGVNIGPLAFTNASTINTVGLNVSNASGSAALTIDASGDINTSGYINAADSITTTTSLNSTSINVKHLTSDTAAVFTVSDTGAVTASDNLTIGSHFAVTSSSGAVASGSQTITGTVASSGNMSVGGTKVVLGNDGTISAENNLAINTNKFNVTASSGSVAFAGDLAIASDKFTVASASGNVVSKGTFSGLGDVAINTNKFNVTASTGAVAFTGDLAIATDKFTVASSSGNVVSKGTISGLSDLAINTNKFNVTASSGAVAFTGDLAIATDKFTVASASGNVVSKGTFSGLGDVAINTDKFTVVASDGHATSKVAYGTYVLPASATDTTTTSATVLKPLTTSSTSTYLTTQEYVDKQLWNQTERINTMLGVDNTIIDNFNNVYKLVSAMAGDSDTVVALQNINDKYNGLVDRSSEIVTSVSEVVAQAFNTVPVACHPNVWADECGPMPIPSAVTLTGNDGWFFENAVAGSKVNWYLPTNGTAMKMSDIQNMYLNTFLGSNKATPFITVYTKAKGNANDHTAGYFGARINYYFDLDVSVTRTTSFNEHYCFHTGEAPMNVYNATKLQCSSICTADATNKNNATFGSVGATVDSSIVSDSDEILLIGISSASTSAVSDAKFIINTMNIQLKTGTTQFTFSNSGVAANFQSISFSRMNTDLSTVKPKNIAWFKAYKAAYLNVSSFNTDAYAATWA